MSPPVRSEPSLRLRCELSGSTKNVFPVTSPGHYVIGAADIATIRFSDPSLSPRHACLILNFDRTLILDLESSGGTYLNDCRVQVAEVAVGDEIRCGDVRLRLEVDSEADHPTILNPQPNACDDLSQRDSIPVIAGYAGLKLVGRGSLGVVYRAVELGTNQVVALKRILPDKATDPRLQQLFLREASILSQLKHARIIDCRGFGITSDGPYLTMEYFPTEDLESIVLGHPSPRRFRLAVKIVLELLDALSYAHAKGIVHRDIKPSNVLCSTKTGRLRLKLGDFGLAKFYQTAGYSGISNSNDVCGTVAYMAPEQILDSRASTPSCDVYSTSVLLYRLITGRFPFPDGSLTDTIQRRLSEPAIPTQIHTPECPDDLARIIDLSLSRSIELRFPSASVLREELQNLTLLHKP